jgi:hypothetical protein
MYFVTYLSIALNLQIVIIYYSKRYIIVLIKVYIRTMKTNIIAATIIRFNMHPAFCDMFPLP